MVAARLVLLRRLLDHRLQRGRDAAARELDGGVAHEPHVPVLQARRRHRGWARLRNGQATGVQVEGGRGGSARGSARVVASTLLRGSWSLAGS